MDTLDERIATFEADYAQAEQTYKATLAEQARARILGQAYDEPKVLNARVYADIARETVALLKQERDEQNKATADAQREEKLKALATARADAGDVAFVEGVAAKFAAAVSAFCEVDTELVAQCNRIAQSRGLVNALQSELGIEGGLPPAVHAESIRQTISHRWHQNAMQDAERVLAWFRL